jgi:hypothetical protein
MPESFRFAAIRYPGRAKFIDKHPETNYPEGFLHRHLNFPILRPYLQYPPGFRTIVYRQRNVKAFSLFVVSSPSRRTHHALLPTRMRAGISFSRHAG